jgi:holo-[acyl-carrier protein] synthase
MLNWIVRSRPDFAKISRKGPSGLPGEAVMEIVGIGTDIVECLRIGRMIEQHGELFLRRVFTDREIRYCNARRRTIEHFAGRWAAKEAILKALGTGWRRGLSWTDVEVRNEPGGKPTVHLCGSAKDIAQGLQVGDILLSISHCRAYATAYALALRGMQIPF